MAMASRSPRRQCARAGAAACLLACLLTGCSSAMVDSMPASIGGLPEGAPERPAVPPAYPAVHDMPPPRADSVLSEAEKKKLREDLAATRERAARRAAEPDATAATGGTQAGGTAR